MKHLLLLLLILLVLFTSCTVEPVYIRECYDVIETYQYYDVLYDEFVIEEYITTRCY